MTGMSSTSASNARAIYGGEVTLWVIHADLRIPPALQGRPASQLVGHRVPVLAVHFTSDQFGIVQNRQRPTRQVTLNLLATFLREKRILGFGLDTFREDLQVKASAEPDNCTHN